MGSNRERRAAFATSGKDLEREKTKRKANDLLPFASLLKGDGSSLSWATEGEGRERPAVRPEPSRGKGGGKVRDRPWIPVRRSKKQDLWRVYLVEKGGACRKGLIPCGKKKEIKGVMEFKTNLNLREKKTCLHACSGAQDPETRRVKSARERGRRTIRS